jgi:hypothetical protein
LIIFFRKRRLNQPIELIDRSNLVVFLVVA